LFGGAVICVWPMTRLTAENSATAVAVARVMGVLEVRSMSSIPSLKEILSALY
jgi:hypothetical protein